nr:cupin domain-containing protein [Mesorhizobium sp. M7A.F.Ca.US.006.01.1.1]
MPGALSRAEGVDRGKGKVALSPPPQGVKFRWFTLQPERLTENTDYDLTEYSKVFDMIGGSDTRPDTSRHPSMHLTQTIDFIILLRGQVRLLLDDDERVIYPGDVVVQRGTNHAWVCESEEPALLIAVLIDKVFAD